MNTMKQAVIFILAMACILTGCGKEGASSDYHRRIKITERSYFTYRKYLPLPTGGPVPVRTIEIDGVKYDNVRGGEPPYLDLPQAESIVFATAKLEPKKKNSYGMVLHLYNFKSKQHILFEPAGALDQTAIYGVSECVMCAQLDSFDGQTLVLGYKDSFTWFKMVFNLKTARYETMYRWDIDRTKTPAGAWSLTPAGATNPVFAETNVYHY